MKNTLQRSIAQAFRFLLVEQRYSKNISQYKLAKESGFSRQYISLIECGKRMPTIIFLFSIAHCLGMSEKDFMNQLIDKILYFKEQDN
jgi:transcriptional regulator with XRE-family HTH domain